MASAAEIKSKADELRRQARQLDKFVGKPLLKKELADGLGVSVMTLNNWEHDGAPVTEVLKSQIEDAITAINDWRKNNKRPRYWSEAEADKDGTLQERLLAAQIRKNNADAESKEIKNRERKGELCETSEAESQVAELVNLIRHRLESAPDEIVGDLPNDCRDVALERMKDKVYLILTEMSQWRLGE